MSEPSLQVALHVGQLLQPIPGGIGRYVSSLAGALPAVGVGVRAFAAGPAPAGLAVPYTDLGRPTGPVRYEAWHRLRRPALSVPGDVVHATSLAVPPPGRRPLVVTIHDLVFLRQPEHLTRRGVSFHERGLALARREAAAIVVPSAFGKEDLVAEGVPADRIHVAHHGVELRPLPAAPLVELGARPPYVLFVGTVEPRKGVADLLAAFEPLRSSHPDLQLVLAGPTGWGELPDLHRPGVLATGNVGEEVLDALYRSAVALALPSSYEGFGLPVVEAMARGCPVVTSDAACLPEVAGDAGVVVPLGDVDALAGALHRLVVDGDHRAELVAASLRRAAAFTWAASAEAHRRAYEAATA